MPPRLVTGYCSGDQGDDSEASSGMTLRKSTRILRKSVPALPIKMSNVKKPLPSEHAQSRPMEEATAEPVKEAEMEGESLGERGVL